MMYNLSKCSHCRFITIMLYYLSYETSSRNVGPEDEQRTGADEIERVVKGVGRVVVDSVL